jgi:transcriptional regulator with XRE-family HTH domain
MAIHIGKIIKGLVKSKGMSVTKFADAISYSRRNVYEIFDRETIDTGLLQRISKVLEQNLFLHYITEAEIVAFKNKRVKNEELLETLAKLTETVERIDKNTSSKDKAVSAKKK